MSSSGNSGENGANIIENCYATGSVTAENYQVGGLVGLQSCFNSKNTISNCYATGNVSGNDNVGGLVGLQSSEKGTDTILNCYVAGNISGSGSVGGLVGQRIGFNSIINSYRYENLTINGSVIPDDSDDINGIHGDIKTAAEFMTKTTYTSDSWLFNDSVPASGPWFWDSSGFPKLNMGTESFPFPWE
jgi:hypothetical protein